MAHNYGLPSANNCLLWGIVAYHFQLLGCPGRSHKTGIPEITTHRISVVLWAPRPDRCEDGRLLSPWLGCRPREYVLWQRGPTPFLEVGAY